MGGRSRSTALGSASELVTGLAASLCRPPNRNKADLDSLIQGARDPAQHRQGVAFVIAVLKAADDRCCGINDLGELSLGKARRGPQIADLAGDVLVCVPLRTGVQPGALVLIES